MLRIAPVGFLLAHHAGSDFPRISQPQLVPALRQQPLEPGIVLASFHPYPHSLPRQRTVKLLRLGAVTQPFFLILPSFVVKDRDLLKPRMKITAYNQHDVGSFSVSLGRFAATNLLAAFEPTSLCNQAQRELGRIESHAKSRDLAFARLTSVRYRARSLDYSPVRKAS